MDLLYFLLIGAVSGWLAGILFKGWGFGLIGNIIVGIVGSVLGGWIAAKIGIGGTGLFGHIVIAALGGWLLLFIISLFSRR
ncbi:GlsB/YeaQ/YmgE family stress response membrane protein [Dyadobacter luteus]|uniref:GlsB/YeaQ/YmgE family stress response membrane protein n=1 Tax=Dyadobacter luteus TaxID=2259619 RepID=A0A3D8YEK6_9BACT|nr:GlsB/YeaQ/YmgE family stress response membrane protein [Dyadobacter luteus]REA62922.1 GlsB/YeaQ/YmgE family stress response membrane protein [Dyadobacter luteus]